MPELPEMQALSERLDGFLTGARLERIDAMQFSALKTVTPSAMDLVGGEVTGVTRRGKYLIVKLPPNRLLVHLSQGGRVDVEDPPKQTRPKGAVARLVFDRPPAILIKEFGTERKAAWWVLAEDDPGPLAELGPEPFSDDYRDLVEEGDDKRRVHTLLRDQRTVTGIGRGFSDDILHHARISPYASLASLSPEQRAGLIASTHEVLQGALERERERSGGLPAKLHGRFTVHGKHGEPCPRCGDTLRRVSYESHEVVYCPACQTDGKILADRRLSRLLK